MRYHGWIHYSRNGMVKTKEILEFSERIIREFHPERIILFGSYAHGNSSVDSDVDLLVIMPFKGKGCYKSVEILDKIKPRIPVDLLVRTPEQVRQRLAWNDFFMREIIEKGKVLYEADHQGVD